ncbi:MAG: flagellin lysine-N-methylase [Clostridium sp.]|nr:flagellin lysine-N-methylase [Clostridium sp.]
MKYRTVSWYNDFRCIGGICEDSCCENWEIDLDEASLKHYMKQGGDFGKRLRDSTRVKDRQFILNGTRCPFLNEENLCDIYIELGEGSLCETCTNFPRHIEEFEDLKEVSLTMSCPEASRIMLGKEQQMTFCCWEGTDSEYGLKPMEPVHSFAFWKRKHTNKLDKPLFEILFAVRENYFAILQDRTRPVQDRAAEVLLSAYELQERIDQRQYEQLRQELAKGRPEAKGRLEAQQEKLSARYGSRTPEKKMWMKQLLNMFEGLENIKKEWKELLQAGKELLNDEDVCQSYESAGREFSAYYQEREYEFEHILVYYIFNYFLGASYDRDALTKVKFAVVSYLVIMELDTALWLKQAKQFTNEDQVRVAHAYSKEVEHSYNNFESLQLVVSAHPLLDIEHILVGLLS